jgi:uncharacterized membrane protein
LLIAGLRLIAIRIGGDTSNVQYLLALALVAVALYALLAGRAEGLRYYPVVVNALLLSAFAGSLWRGMPVIERMARLTEPDLSPQAVSYTRRVTGVWCLFFLFNGLVALFTAIWGSFELWTLYNGFLSYILMAALFGAEWLVRRRVRGRHENAGTG